MKAIPLIAIHSRRAKPVRQARTSPGRFGSGEVLGLRQNANHEKAATSLHIFHCGMQETYIELKRP
jgi:hypothetical protein